MLRATCPRPQPALGLPLSHALRPARPLASENDQVLKETSPGHWVACQVRTGVAIK